MIHPMRTTLQRCLIPAAALLLFAAALTAQSPEWKAYNYPSDGFRVSFPSAPELSKDNVSTDTGTFELRSYMAEVATTALYIGVCDYGAKAASADPDLLLEDAKKGAVNSVKGRLLSEKKITLGAYHGVEFEADGATMHLSARSYMVGGVLYQTMVISPLAGRYPETARFLDSFHLLPRAQK
jgi:hypothetical protein